MNYFYDEWVTRRFSPHHENSGSGDGAAGRYAHRYRDGCYIGYGDGGSCWEMSSDGGKGNGEFAEGDSAAWGFPVRKRRRLL